MNLTGLTPGALALPDPKDAHGHLDLVDELLRNATSPLLVWVLERFTATTKDPGAPGLPHS